MNEPPTDEQTRNMQLIAQREELLKMYDFPPDSFLADLINQGEDFADTIRPQTKEVLRKKFKVKNLLGADREVEIITTQLEKATVTQIEIAQKSEEKRTESHLYLSYSTPHPGQASEKPTLYLEILPDGSERDRFIGISILGDMAKFRDGKYTGSRWIDIPKPEFIPRDLGLDSGSQINISETSETTLAFALSGFPKPESPSVPIKLPRVIHFKTPQQNVSK